MPVGSSPPILGQTIDRCISTPLNGLPQDGGGGGGGEVGEDPREQVARWCWPAFFISVCSIEAGDTEKKTSEKFV